jgi:acetyl esterase
MAARGTTPVPLARVQSFAARLIGSLPAAAKRRLAGAPIRRDGLELDVDMQVLLKLAERDLRPLTGRTPAEARENLRETVRAVQGPQIALHSVREMHVRGDEGQLRARLYCTDDGDNGVPGPLVVYYHGGGWVTGDLDTHDQPCRLLARSSGARVLSVEYRVSPEHRFPAPVRDALAAFRDVVARAGELGTDPRRIAVAGDSAGGHLAAVTAQQCVADGGPAPAFQLLIYPVTDSARVSQSRRTFAEGFVLTKENMDWYEQHFLGDDTDRSDPRVSPLLAGELAGVAPALVVTAGFDPLRDEGEAYARRLQEAGVRALLRRHPGYLHGFINALASGSGPREAVVEMGGALRALL